MRYVILLSLALSSCSVYLSGQDARLSRLEALVDSKADAARTDAALRQLQQLIQNQAADVAAMREQKK